MSAATSSVLTLWRVGYSAPEIARLVGLSPKGVYDRIYRARLAGQLPPTARGMDSRVDHCGHCGAPQSAWRRQPRDTPE